MANVVIFLDHAKAHIFELHPEKTEEHSLIRHEVSNHRASVEKAQNKHKDEGKFFGTVMGHLKDANQILLVGPGLAKTEFKHYLESAHSEVNKKIVGIETVDHPTPNQIIALGKKFFKDHLGFF